MRLRTKVYWVIVGYGVTLTVLAALMHSPMTLVSYIFTAIELMVANYSTNQDEDRLKGE